MVMIAAAAMNTIAAAGTVRVNGTVDSTMAAIAQTRAKILRMITPRQELSTNLFDWPIGLALLQGQCAGLYFSKARAILTGWIVSQSCSQKDAVRKIEER